MTLPSGLSPDTAERFKAWREPLAKKYREISSIPLLVLVLGASPKSRFGGVKRIEVIAHLRAERRQDDVATPEDLFNEFGQPDDDILLGEMQQAEVADVILCVLSSSSRNTGALSEIQEFVRDPSILRKLRVYVRKKDREHGFDRGLLANSLRLIDPGLIHDFNDREWKTCNDLREQAVRDVDSVRRSRAWSRRRNNVSTA